MRVHHLNCGTMRPFGGRLVDEAPGILRRAEMVCHCLLLETRDSLVLVDTGFGTADVKDPQLSLPRDFRVLTHPALAPEETALFQVTRLGYDPADVRHIVLTHLDVDHTGGLRDFPWATVHIHQPELQAATAHNAPSRYRPMHWAHQPHWAVDAATSGQSWFGFEAVRNLQGLTDDIMIIPLAGHTTGHTGVAINTGSGWLLHAGDAYFSHQQMATPPRCPAGLRAFQVMVDTHRGQRRHNQQRLHQLAQQHPEAIDIICAHDPTDLRRQPAAEPTPGSAN